MKKSEENLKKGISGNPIHEETSQEIREEAATNSSKKATPTTISRNSFSGIFQRLVCSSSSKLPDDTSEIVSIPKAQPK